VIRTPAAYWYLALCVAWLLPGLVGHSPWKGPDSETFARLLAARQQADWLFPASAVESTVFPQPFLWLAQFLGKFFSPVFPLHDAARLASGVFAGLSLWLTAMTARRLYGEQAYWMSALALLGCMGLLVPAHETNPYMAQLAAIALFVYGLARMLEQPLVGGGLAGLGLAGLFLSGAWLVAVALTLALLLLPVLFPSWRTSARVGGSWFALTVGLTFCGVWLLAVMGQHPERLALWWQQSAMEHIVFTASDTAKYNPLYFINALTWFAWPAWPVAGWAVYRLKRDGWDSVRLWMPLGVFLVALLALSLHTGSDQLQAIVLLPALALLASAGLGDLRRGAANALLWFSLMVFSFFALVFWVYWSAFDLGWPVQLAKRVSRLGLESQGIRAWPLALGLLITVSWVGWLVWLKRQPRAPQRPFLVWSAGITFIWCLLLALFQQPLEDRLSFVRMAANIKSRTGETACLSTQNLNQTQRLLLGYHTGLALKPGKSAECNWLLAYRKSRKEISPGAGWAKRWEGGRPGEKNERYWLYQKSE
jgi:4-amino-4-deoxy-L-arabinose transferase-like glycosyltransferase